MSKASKAPPTLRYPAPETSSRAAKGPERRRVLLLQLELPGGTRFLGRVTRSGCAPVEATGANALILISDDRDARFGRVSPIDRAEADEMAADLNPDAVFRLLYRPGTKSVVYARARDEIPEQGRACPLLLALEMLGAADERPQGMLILAIGTPTNPDLVLMVGRDISGAIDPASLQVWLLPQDDLLTLAVDFAERGQFELQADHIVYTQHELLQLARQLPHYERARTYFGRTVENWMRAGAGIGAVAGVATALACGVQALALAHVEQQRAQADARVAAMRDRLQAVVQQDPIRLSMAASIDQRQLVDAARTIWRNGTTVRIEARPGQERLTLRTPISAAPGRDPAESAVDEGGDLVHEAMNQQPPRGFTRGPIQVSGDFNAMAITYQSESRRSTAAGLLMR
ncbi:MAG TPA: hypothetical protein VMU33_09660 [Burkholderiaceae bacterium]|nr:hypothetical protein [Burkholderiaceae bacterium]